MFDCVKSMLAPSWLRKSQDVLRVRYASPPTEINEQTTRDKDVRLFRECDSFHALDRFLGRLFPHYNYV